MTTHRTRLAALAAATLLHQALLAQPQSGDRPAFDVASVRALAPGERRGSDAVRLLPGGRVTAPAVTLRGLVAAAYGVQDIQVIDENRLFSDGRFAVEARTKSNVTAGEARAMLRTLLADRFKLAVHLETRTLPVYVMSGAGRTGAELRRSGPECAPPRGPANSNVPPPPPPPPPPGGPPPADAITLGPDPMRCLALNMRSTVGSHYSIREVTMDRFAQILTGSLQRPVINRTTLAGTFDIDLTYSDESTSVADVAPNAPSLFTAMQEQLGLKLESSRAPVEVVVVDAVGTLTEN